VPWGQPLPAYKGKWVSELYDAQKTRVSGYFVGLVARRPTISVDVPVPRALGKRYVVSQIFDASYFAKRVRRPGHRPRLGHHHLRRQRHLDRAQPQRRGLVGKPVRPELYQASRRQPNGVLRHTTHDGVDVYSVYTRAPLSGWTVAIGVPASEIEAQARDATLYAALSLLGVMGLAIGIAVFLAKRLSVSLDQARASRPRRWPAAPSRRGAYARGRSRHAAGRPAPHQRRPGARTRRPPAACRTSAKPCCAASRTRAARPRPRAMPRTPSSPCSATSCATRWRRSPARSRCSTCRA
jgi:hypothetical protein